MGSIFPRIYLFSNVTEKIVICQYFEKKGKTFDFPEEKRKIYKNVEKPNYE